MIDNIVRSCTPRPEVLAGALSDAVLAASLDEAVAGTAPGIHGDRDVFLGDDREGPRKLFVTALGREHGTTRLLLSASGRSVSYVPSWRCAGRGHPRALTASSHG